MTDDEADLLRAVVRHAAEKMANMQNVNDGTDRDEQAQADQFEAAARERLRAQGGWPD